MPYVVVPAWAPLTKVDRWRYTDDEMCQKWRKTESEIRYPVIEIDVWLIVEFHIEWEMDDHDGQYSEALDGLDTY